MNKTMNTKFSLINLIEGRLSMQSTQRALLDNYGVCKPNLDYIQSMAFQHKLSRWTPFQKKGFFTLLAGPFNWKSAAKLIDKEYSTI